MIEYVPQNGSTMGERSFAKVDGVRPLTPLARHRTWLLPPNNRPSELTEAGK
jgi:hypothetical protein